MQTVRTTVLSVACACLVATLAVAPAALADDANVTFKNMTASTQHILAMYGGDGACSDMPQKEQLTVDPGGSATVESGDSKVCWCSSTVGKIADCNPWSMTKAGKVQKIR